jgi:hypothetical protein
MKRTLFASGAAWIVVLILALTSTGEAAKKKASPSPATSSSPAASATAAPKASASPSVSPGTRMVRVIPFHGMISAVDGRAKTFTIAGKDKSRIFKISDQTTITKTGAPATMKDVVEKEEVRGSYWKEADGTLIARTVKVGPPTAQEKAADDARKAKRAERKAAKAAAAASASPAGSASPAASASPKP